MNNSRLMRIAIPNGWLVAHNNFYDVEPKSSKEDTNFIDNWFEGFTEDVLWLFECKFETDFVIPNVDFYSIDLGWLPDSNIEGKYQLRLYWNSKEELILKDEFESENRFLIRDKIEYWFEDIEKEKIKKRDNITK